MCTEFWNGWFDHWGEAHHLRSPQEAADVLDEILSAGDRCRRICSTAGPISAS